MQHANTPPVVVVDHVPETLEDAISSVRQSGSHAWSVFVSPHREHAKNRHLVYQARAAVEESLTTFHITNLSPLGSAVLTEMAQPLLKTLPAHKILPALAVLEQELRCFTVTDSIKDMSQPQVPLLLHARSWIPGGTYVAELHNRVKSHSAKKPEKTLSYFDPALQGHIAIVAESQDTGKAGARIGRATEKLLNHLSPQDIARRPNPQPQWWGSTRSAQIVLAPTRLGAAAQTTIAEPIEYQDIPARALCALPKPLEEAK